MEKDKSFVAYGKSPSSSEILLEKMPSRTVVSVLEMVTTYI